MEVVNSRSALLSNYEVYSLLQGISLKDKKGKSRQQASIHLANITYDTTKYLDAMPCRFQNKAIIHNFFTAVADFKLTKIEKLQLLNLRPTTPVAMQLIIEESEERVTEDQIKELINLVKLYLPDESSCTLPNGS